jgi:cytochrome c-type biogenesis protein CcmF
MFWHLVVDVVIFALIAAVLLIVRWKEMPISKKEEETYSREFWMFVGSVFLALSCLQLVIVTSIPVWNAIFKTSIAPPSNPVTLYNVFQAGFAVVVTLLTGVTQFLKYKKTDVNRFFITSVVYIISAALITGVIVYVTGVYKLHIVFILVMLGAVYSVLVNGKVLADAFKGKLKLAGSAVAHIGFGLIMIGALIAAGTKTVISQNTTGMDYGADFDKGNSSRENIMLYKNEPLKMGDYMVTYVGDSIAPPNHYFKIDYKRLDAAGNVLEDFILKPNSQFNNKMGLVSSPDTKHYLFHDLYTHISMAPLNVMQAGMPEGHDEDANDDANYNAPISHDVSVGDTIPYRDGYIILSSLNKEAHVQNIPLSPNDVAVGAQLKIVSHGITYQAEPVYMIKGGNVFDFARKVDDAGLKLRLSKIIPEKNKVEIMVYDQPESKRPYVVMRAIDFPYINFLWSGTVIMAIGFLLAIFRRNKELKTV